MKESRVEPALGRTGRPDRMVVVPASRHGLMSRIADTAMDVAFRALVTCCTREKASDDYAAAYARTRRRARFTRQRTLTREIVAARRRHDTPCIYGSRFESTSGTLDALVDCHLDRQARRESGR